MKIENQERINKNAPLNDRIAFLRHCANLYETDGTSPLSDKQYDEEYYALKTIAPHDPFFQEVGGIDETHIYGTQTKHDVIMGSYSKCPDIPSFEQWLKSNYRSFASFILQHKIDGLSLSLVYENGELTRAATRGNGTIGIDVTNNALHVNGVLTQIAYDGKVEVRGECYKNRQDFYKNWHGLLCKNGHSYKNPRNFAAGSINQKNALITKERGLDFVAYEVVQKDFDTEIEKNNFLISCGFNTLKDTTSRTKCDLSSSQIVKAVAQYMEAIDRSQLPYNIDGIVVKLNDIKMAKKMGATDGGRKPKANRAVKFPPEEKETILEGIETNVGRMGYLTPVAVLKPVEIGGAMIGRATLHNFKALVGDDAVKIGAKVVIAKKGDIIPQIIRIKQNGNESISLPKTCPSCGGSVEWDKSNTEIVCNNINCPAQLNKKIEHWFKKIGVKGIGGGTIAKLTDPEILSWNNRAIIETLPEMYYMLGNDKTNEESLEKIKILKDFFGEQAYKNVVDSIKSVDKISVSQLIEAMGIGQVGRTASDIVEIAPTVDQIDDLTIDQVASIPGFAQIKAESFVNGWKAVREEIATIMKHIEIISEELKSDKLNGQKFCFTGSFSMPRKEMQNIAIENGGKAASSVGKGTILVWDGEEQGSKYNKAIAKDNRIISEKEFFHMVR